MADNEQRRPGRGAAADASPRRGHPQVDVPPPEAPAEEGIARDLAVTWLVRRFAVPPRLAATLAAHAGLGGRAP
jgi:hypothetical protein